jgi:hypothetical protein
MCRAMLQRSRARVGTLSCPLVLSLLRFVALQEPSLIAQTKADPEPDRTTLPIREPSYPPNATLNVRNARPPAFFEVKAPARAPNVVLVLIDDMGFGHHVIDIARSTIGRWSAWLEPVFSGRQALLCPQLDWSGSL